jgi:hypothetical protein
MSLSLSLPLLTRTVAVVCPLFSSTLLSMMMHYAFMLWFSIRLSLCSATPWMVFSNALMFTFSLAEMGIQGTVPPNS